MKSEFEVENKNLEEVVDEILLLMPEMADEKYNEILHKLANVIQAQLCDDIGKWKTKSIILRNDSKYHKVFLRDIVFAETVGRKIIIHTKANDFEYLGTLGELESKLGAGFFRTHRSYIVNMEFVTSFDIESVQMIKGEAILAKARYQDFVLAMKTMGDISG